MKKKTSGFSLIELLVVMMILGLLVSLVGPALFGKADSSRVKAAEAQIKLLSTALDTYRLDVGLYPKNLDGLISDNVRGWDGPYLPQSLPQDPWGNTYQYERTNTGFSLMSFGKDGKLGGEDDNADITF